MTPRNSPRKNFLAFCRKLIYNATMSHVSAALTAALDRLSWKQIDLAQKTGIQASQINRYVRGTADSIPIDSMAKLLGAFEEADQAPILVAYLRDCTPANFAHLVEITESTYRVKELPPGLPDGIDPEFREMLQRMALLGRRHAEVRDMVSSFLRIVSPKGE